MSQRETGWSSAHDVERKAIHDFRNSLQELVFAVERQDKTLVSFYAQELLAQFENAVKGSNATPPR